MHNYSREQLHEADNDNLETVPLKGPEFAQRNAIFRYLGGSESSCIRANIDSDESAF